MNDFIQNISPVQMSGALLVLAVIAHIALGIILKQITKHSSNTKTQLDDHLISAISAPLKLLIWYGWLYFSLVELTSEIPPLSQIVSYIVIAPVFILTWGILRLISNTETYMLNKEGSIDKDSVRLFTRLTKILFVFAIILGVAQFYGYAVSSILTLGGVGGIVVGFAAKDMLANIFGGLMIQMDKPFSTGDWIRTTDKSIEGVVEKIGWRMTRIRTFSKNPVYVPNGIFATIPIETPSRMTNRQIYEVIGIRYDDIAQMESIIEKVQELLAKSKNIDHKEPCRVYFDVFNASSLDFVIWAFSSSTDATEFKTFKGRLLLDIAQIISDHGAEIAYPTQTLHIQKT
ncbi:MAG: mechanosensitive ion channel family protein [Candidatus Thioglobus sp.]|jgi:MscS family membrane protein|nr:mechanosensitive ion channel family protein [Candidatus Pseudothioglobus aerophilus]MBT3440131.1 mechanosensitive ion channel family protein [Gammaproteobacteria bacterium]MDP0559933.1 mechanosensitive ion channel family protein [Candidatus Thioglobus sp.]MBT4245439.1 mechanosensitive ion channel family protein [Gammaproteobacteria bacterium]MBT4975311.1 mechanosensitive ion channel family protein [Gammaproteobacteria bacterium]